MWHFTCWDFFKDFRHTKQETPISLTRLRFFLPASHAEFKAGIRGNNDGDDDEMSDEKESCDGERDRSFVQRQRDENERGDEVKLHVVGQIPSNRWNKSIQHKILVVELFGRLNFRSMKKYLRRHFKIEKIRN